MNNHNDVFLEQLANKGDGLCNYIDTPLEARRALVDNFTGAFQTIARDVKLQVEFDPAQVRSWRQLGYENRFVADADFRNDAVDAGEVGAGHQVVALFEVERRSGSSEEQALATVRLRWKEPSSGRESSEGDQAARDQAARETDRRVFPREALGDFRATPAGFRRAVLVAQFAEVLRSSVHAREDSLALLLERSFELEREAKDPDFTELVELMRATRDHLRSHCERDEWTRTVDSYRFNAWRRAECEDEGREETPGEMERLQRERQELELRLRELSGER
jgi:Ca-activated chloride channel family protein